MENILQKFTFMGEMHHDSQRGSSGPPVAHLEFLMVHREFQE